MGSYRSFLAGVGTGTLLALALDPRLGRRRRAMLRDKAIRSVHELEDAVQKGVRDLGHRAHGRLAEARGWFSDHAADDEVIHERVRAELGRWVSHPHTVAVTCREGCVTLTGPILEREVDALVCAIEKVRGVKQVKNEMTSHASSAGQRAALARETWSPASQLMGGVGGLALITYGLTQRNLLGRMAALLGAAWLVRMGAGHRALDFHKTITVDAPLYEVYPFWKRFENFPRFMEHVEEVRDLGDGRSRWTVKGPAGKRLSWDAEITRLEENRCIAWKTLPGQVVEHAGIIHFEPTPERGTRLDIRLSYRPPAGALGHAVASLFRADPKHAMDDDLVRFKSLMEQDKASAHGKTVTREQL